MSDGLASDGPVCRAEVTVDLAAVRRHFAAFCKFIDRKNEDHYRAYIIKLMVELKPEIEMALNEVEKSRNVV